MSKPFSDDIACINDENRSVNDATFTISKERRSNPTVGTRRCIVYTSKYTFQGKVELNIAGIKSRLDLHNSSTVVDGLCCSTTARKSKFNCVSPGTTYGKLMESFPSLTYHYALKISMFLNTLRHAEVSNKGQQFSEFFPECGCKAGDVLAYRQILNSCV